MDVCRLSIAATGAFLHPLGDQTPIDCRYGEMIDTVDLPHRWVRLVNRETAVDFGALENPRAAIIWNVSGLGLQIQPTEEEAAKIAEQVLQVGLCGPIPGGTPEGWQSLRAARAGHDQGGSTILWLSPGTGVVVRPQNPGTSVLVRALIIPGNDAK